MANLQDFGKKIGGARKDLWAGRGLISSDLTDMTDLERESHIKKDNIWLKPNWVDLVSKGADQGVAYWQNKMRQSIPPKPPANDQATQDNYIEVVTAIRDAVMAVRDPHEIDIFYQKFLRENYVTTSGRSYYVDIVPEAKGIVTNKVLGAAQSKYRDMKQEAKDKLFGIPKENQTYHKIKNNLSVHHYDGENTFFEPLEDDYHAARLTVSVSFGKSFYYFHKTDELSNPDLWQPDTYFILDKNNRRPVKTGFQSREEAEAFIETKARTAQEQANKLTPEKGKGSKRKGAFVPPQLRSVKREGPKYRGIRHANSDFFLNDLKFRGGEFGNWLNHDDRQVSLDMAYDGLRDLARVLNIRPEDISLGGTLAIAFGARGKGGINAGAAHYETARQVINLTKMSGAGCLAHEWGHALDHAIGITNGQSGLASEAKKIPDSLREVVDAMKYKTVTITPDEVQKAALPKIEYCKKNLTSWINSVKPKNLTDNMEKKWDSAVEKIFTCSSEFTGGEYVSFGRKGEVKTKPEVELLSQIRKFATNRGIPRDTKHQIAVWAAALAANEKTAQRAEPAEKRVETDFYKGSIHFDKVFSRASHGYYQSTCEMFARAFDCYVADKLKAEGLKSDYLTAYADSFILPPSEDGKRIAAVPLGEERKVIFEKMDDLIANLKEQGLLHNHVEEKERPEPQEDRKRAAFPSKPVPTTPVYPKYEQLSLDDLLFAASTRAVNQNSERGRPTPDHSR